MLATVRNRRGLVTSVEPFDGGAEGRFHLTTIEFLDTDGPSEQALLWEREPHTRLLEPTALPAVERDRPMDGDEFDAVTRAARWMALTPFLDPDEDGPVEARPLTAPFHGAIQIEDFQLVPLLKALRMPRVSLLLADDVGLGKTVEAGLVLRELIVRRRVRRALIVCPAALRTQWKEEMEEKFSLPFDIVDRRRTHELQKHLGLDANPWRTFSRVITSADFLKQPHVLEQFRAACRPTAMDQSEAASARLPWDVLIVDEAHNHAPSAFGEDSQLTEMLRIIAPWCEHRLFLTATPHNGFTRSFTGLLEILDPVRFTQKSENLTDPEKDRVAHVVVRRMKSEINARTDPPRFAERHVEAVRIQLSGGEQRLSDAYQAFRSRVHRLVASGGSTSRRAGSFAVEILGKRLLSCPTAFADSWHRYMDGMAAAEAAAPDEVTAAERAWREDIDDDRETEERSGHAAQTVGAWLQPLRAELEDEMREVDAALDQLGLADSESQAVDMDPRADSRFDALLELVDRRLMSGGAFRDDERLVVFTEYKTTLDYLERRLRERHQEGGRVLTLFGGMEESERDEIKAAFNDPSDPVRILLATDAAAEGLNLQETARFVLHYDVPWNPARLEQRNGRLDRHGQARDVVAHHFTTDDDADLAFLSYVVGKVDTIREDLGSTGDVFAEALERRLIRGEDAKQVRDELDRAVSMAQGRADVPRDIADVGSDDEGRREMERHEALAHEVDLSPESLRETLDVALATRSYERPRLRGPDERGRYRFATPIPPDWQGVIDDALRVGQEGGRRGARPALVFDAEKLMEELGRRRVFRRPRDTALLHLGHPLFEHALHFLARARYRLGEGGATRWTVRRGPLPEGADALLLLTLEEMAVNRLRETFHHWVHTVRLPVHGHELGEVLEHRPASQLRRGAEPALDEESFRAARDVWVRVEHDVQAFIQAEAESLTRRLEAALETDGQRALEEERERFQQRQGEVSELIERTTLERLERELEKLRASSEQLELLDAERRIEKLEQSIAEKEEEVRRRRHHYEELRQQLSRERVRVIEEILPRRFALRDSARVLPVTVEIRLPVSHG